MTLLSDTCKLGHLSGKVGDRGVQRLKRVVIEAERQVKTLELCLYARIRQLPAEHVRD